MSSDGEPRAQCVTGLVGGAVNPYCIVRTNTYTVELRYNELRNSKYSANSKVLCQSLSKPSPFCQCKSYPKDSQIEPLSDISVARYGFDIRTGRH